MREFVSLTHSVAWGSRIQSGAVYEPGEGEHHRPKEERFKCEYQIDHLVRASDVRSPLSIVWPIMRHMDIRHDLRLPISLRLTFGKLRKGGRARHLSMSVKPLRVR